MTSKPINSAPEKVLHLDITKVPGHLKISLASQRAGEMQTVRHVEEVAVSMERIGQRHHKMVETLNCANRNGRMTPDLMQKLKEIGQHFRDELFSVGIKSRLNNSRADQLVITIDDQLVHIPWELLHDGQAFLCQQFAMGRVVRTRQVVANPESRIVRPPLQMLILADPGGDLKAAYAEGVGLRDYMDKFQSSMRVAFRSQGVNTDLLKVKIRNYDLIHFAGHATYDDLHPENSGWRLSKGCLTGTDIVKMAGTGSMPALVFSNACQSARTEAWDASSNMHHRIFGLANAFILSGVKHYVGTFWEIPDETSKRFSEAFYQYLLNGMPIGKALQSARRSLIEWCGEDNVIWASYLLYGDPTSTYVDSAPSVTETEPPPTALAGKSAAATVSETRSPEDVIHFASHPPTGKFRKPVMLGVGAFVLALIAAFFVLGSGDGRHYEQQDKTSLDGLAVHLEAKAHRDADQQRQVRIDRLVTALTKQMSKTSEPLSELGWSSRPLTVWVMDLEKIGDALQEGSSVLLASAMSDRLLQQKSIQVVERALLDKMMAELKLSTSELSDPHTMLLLGRLVSARLILYGRMVHSAPQAQVAVRCIDTETGQVVAIVNSDFDAQTGLVSVARRVADELTLKLKKHYPLRGVIIEKRNDHLVLDIGQKQGASAGMTFKAIDVDLTVEIVDVKDDRSTAKVQGDPQSAAVGLRLEAIPNTAGLPFQGYISVQ